MKYLEEAEPKKGKILSVDYGRKFIGLAVSDQNRSMPFGRGVLKKDNFEEIAQAISLLCQKEGISEMLIGLPLNEEGTDTPQTIHIRNFAEKLQKYLDNSFKKIPFTYIDESFSSFEAGEFLTKMGIKKHEQKPHLDEMAAIFILGRYIDF